MLELSVKIENGALVVGRLQLMGEAAAVFGGSKVAVGSSLNYASYVVQGTKPHLILPRARKALFWPGAAHPVRSVSHPGTKPNPFMQDALEAAAPQAEAALVSAAAEVINGSGNAQTLKQGLWKAGLLVQAAMVTRAPVKTGGLRQSLHTEVA